jgi:hypothetical protein
MLWTIVGALLIVFVGLPILLQLMATKGFWIFVGFLILLIAIGISVATPPPKQQVSTTTISPIGELNSPLPNCTNSTIQDPCGTFDTNVYPLTVQPIASGTFLLH